MYVCVCVCVCVHSSVAGPMKMVGDEYGKRSLKMTTIPY